MSKGFDIPSNKHLGNSHDYWKAPQVNSKQIVVQPLQWLPIDRDENGFASIESVNAIVNLHKDGIPVALASKDSYGYTYDVISPIHDIFEWYGDIEHHAYYTHYLPIPKLEV